MLLNLSRLRKQQARMDTMMNTQHHDTFKHTHRKTHKLHKYVTYGHTRTHTNMERQKTNRIEEKLKTLMSINGPTTKKERQREKKNTHSTFEIQLSSLVQLYIFRNIARSWKVLDTKREIYAAWFERKLQERSLAMWTGAVRMEIPLFCFVQTQFMYNKFSGS